MSSSRLGRYVSWIILMLILMGAWVALRITERQLLRLRAAQESDAPAAPHATLRSVGPFASESGPVGDPGEASRATGPTGEEGETGTPRSETDARPVPPGAIR